MAGWIKWVSGRWPFIGIDQYTSTKDPRWENWLIGMVGYETGLGETVTPVPIVDGWHWYGKTITIPEGTAYIWIKDELWGKAGRGGSPLGYFDDLALFELVVLSTIDIAPDLMHLRWKDKIYPLPYSRNFRWMSQYKNANLLLIAH